MDVVVLKFCVLEAVVGDGHYAEGDGDAPEYDFPDFHFIIGLSRIFEYWRGVY